MKLLLFITLFFFHINYGRSCSCIGKDSVESAYSSSDVVVEGTIISIESFQVTQSSKDSLDFGIELNYRKVKMIVSKAYKGQEISDTITIYTGVGGGDCGFNFNKNEKYIVYGMVKRKLRNNIYYPLMEPFIYTSICDRTSKTTKEEICALKKLIRKHSEKK